ncbi:YicC/YloC family endoribonuclease [Pasteurella multocida]|uniref:YicC/YloC family endoribonuclease n=1 Tax=Pasteurella multocida TaxID=747 RepID=UPI00397B2C65
MIYSMTAFARLEIKQDWGDAVWGIRSVNQRYLETFFRLPEQFRGLENTLREKLRQKLTRGKIECTLRIDNKKQAATEIHLNKAFALQVIQSLQWIKQQAGEGEIHLNDVLRYPGVVEVPEQDLDLISQQLLSAFDSLLTEFIAMRAREGEKLNTLLQQRLDAAEELDRLQLHVKETKAILQKGGAVGRKLDFMMQELNRESNTLASKSISTEVTNSAVELKVLIEQMREQIQNLE